MNVSNYASRFEQERTRLGLGMTEVADHVGMSWQAVYNWERGRNTPSFVTMSKLTEIGYDIHFVLTGRRLGVDNTVECA